MNRAERESLQRCDHTCPAVDHEFNRLWDDIHDLVAKSNHDEVGREIERCSERVKEVGTEKLRAVLIEACEELLEARTEIEELRLQLDRVNDALAEANAEIAELSRAEAA
jgi:molecular chaperone GrpE (heat shock protein)